MRAIICGAGIAGLSLAWWLDRDGWDVLVIERTPGLRDEGYMIDFLGSGYDVAELMGLIPRLKEIHYPIPEMIYVDRSGRRVAGLDYKLFYRLQNGRVFNFMRGDLERVLFEELPESVEVRFDLTIDEVKLTEEHVEVLLSNGEHERADLLVGADGIHSRLRKLVFGDEHQFLRPLGFHTAAYIFEDVELRRDLGGDFRLLSVPNREVGLYPIRDGKVASFFVHRTPDKVLPSSHCKELERVYGDLGWVVPDVLRHCREHSVIYYDLVAQIAMFRWSQGRVTLVGDACQAVSLLAGQGASMAMGGAYLLARELRGNRPVKKCLADYEARLKPIIESKQAAGRRTAYWIVPPSQRRIAARNGVLRLGGLPGLSWLLRPVLTSGTESVVERTTEAARI
jgi:2-polyprenyl-6-methoxyphenol hydroxylase-like FAD-dependent oxidoreductase